MHNVLICVFGSTLWFCKELKIEGYNSSNYNLKLSLLPNYQMSWRGEDKYPIIIDLCKLVFGREKHH